MLFDARGNGKNVGVKDDVLWRETHLSGQYFVSPRTDLGLACIGIGLAFFVKCHHHRSRAIAAHQIGLATKFSLAFFH